MMGDSHGEILTKHYGRVSHKGYSIDLYLCRHYDTSIRTYSSLSQLQGYPGRISGTICMVWFETKRWLEGYSVRHTSFLSGAMVE